MFDDVYLVDDTLRLVDDAAIVHVENKLGIRLPRGYHEFLTTLGHGTFCDQVFLFLPDEIEQKTIDLRKTSRDNFFWDRGVHILPKSKIEQSFHIASSLDGDDLIYHPNSEHSVYVLPRDNDTIYWLTPDFANPLQWHSDSGSPMPVPTFRYFEPAKGRSCVELFTARRDHAIEDIAKTITGSLAGNAETRSIVEDNFQLLFHKSVGSRVQLTRAGDGRIGIRIDYNPKQEATVSACVSRLEYVGFYETGRHAT